MEFDHHCALHKAIKYFDNLQAALARAIQVDRRKINDWLNRDGRTIPYRFAISIELATNGAITREELAPHIRYTRNKHTSPNKNISREKLAEVNEKELKISERVKEGAELQKSMRKRQGQRTDLQLVDEKIKGKKTRAIIAEKLGFSSDFSYRCAQKVVRLGCEKLIRAMDEKLISLDAAAKIAKLSHKEQLKIFRYRK